MKDYIKLAKSIIKKHNLERYIHILLDYWKSNPPTLGHGFAHVLKVGVEAYEIAELNKYEKPEHLFIGGLFHDVYRPAETGDGNEDQTKGAEITQELFRKSSINTEITKKVIDAIRSHDDWRTAPNPPEYDVYLSYGDKISHDILVTYGYVWAVNKFSKSKTGTPKFSNHLLPLYLFLKNEQRAWEIFIKHPIKGSEMAIASYIKINQETMNNYLNDKTGDKFFDYVEAIAESFRKDEQLYLKAFGINSEDASKIMALCY